MLVEAGVDKDSVDKDGRTALMIAALRGHAEVVRVLAEGSTLGTK